MRPGSGETVRGRRPEIALQKHQPFERGQLRARKSGQHRRIQRIAHQIQFTEVLMPGLAHGAASGDERAAQIWAGCEHIADVAHGVVGLPHHRIVRYVEYECLERWIECFLKFRQLSRVVPIWRQP